MRRTYISIVAISLLLANSKRGTAAEPWPAEAWSSAETLTHLDPSFKNNMSGACYNPETETFWVCCNGGPSAFWALKRDQNGSLVVASNNQTQAKYNLGKGDLEGICQANYRDALVYLMVEGADKIREYDVSSLGNAKLKTEWDISAHVPTKGGRGSEGITFVPDAWLKRGIFTDATGEAYVSKNGMGGLMFVAHQNGGRIYVFDLSKSTESVDFVGSYKTSQSESSGLEFDRSTGLLYIWHNTGPNYMEVTKLSSKIAGKERRLSPVAEFVGPKGGNLEGLAITPVGKKSGECLIVDDDNQDGAAIMWFRQFNPAKSFKQGNAEQKNPPDKR